MERLLKLGSSSRSAAAQDAGSVHSARSEGGPSSAMSKLSISAVAVRPHDPSTSSPRPHSTLDVKITNALKELKRKRQETDKEQANPFTRILLKAPLVKQAFNSVRSTFEELDKDHKGYIVYADMEGAFERLGVNFSKEEIGQVFHESDMLENGRLTFKEFLVCLVIGFILHKIPSLENERLSIFYAPMNKDKQQETVSAPPAPAPPSILFGEGNKLRIAFQLAIDAFLWFDVDGNGSINKDEMAMRLGSSTYLHSPTKKMSSLKDRATPFAPKDSESINSIISDRRFNEMDWNHDGTIQFREFLMAFESWVGIDDDDVDK